MKRSYPLRQAQSDSANACHFLAKNALHFLRSKEFRTGANGGMSNAHEAELSFATGFSDGANACHFLAKNALHFLRSKEFRVAQMAVMTTGHDAV